MIAIALAARPPFGSAGNWSLARLLVLPSNSTKNADGLYAPLRHVGHMHPVRAEDFLFRILDRFRHILLGILHAVQSHHAITTQRSVS